MRRSWILTLCLPAVPAFAGPPPPLQSSVPLSDTGGSIEANWVAPFVETSKSRGRTWASSRVRWYSPEGALLAEAEDRQPRVSSLGPYFTSGQQGSLVFHGIYDGWHLPAPSSEDYGIASEDGRVFVQFLRRGEDAAGVSVFVQGRHAVDLGPLPGMTLWTQSVGFDGSTAILLKSESESRPRQVLVTDARGKVRISRPAPGARRVHVARDGTGVLLWHDDGSLVYQPARGAPVPIRFDEAWELAPWFAVWHPERPLVVLHSTETREPGFHALVDCETGETLWAADAPWPAVQGGVQPFGEYVFQTGIEFDPPPADSSKAKRVIRVLDLETGRPFAQWSSGRMVRFTTWQDAGTLMRRDGRLYFMAGREFSEIELESVRRAGEGCCPWERLSGE